MATYTENLNLKKPDIDEFYNVADFNENADKTDAAVANKAPSNHTHLYAGSSAAGGSATSALKLTTARLITIGGAAKSFDGSAAITYTVEEIGAAIPAVDITATLSTTWTGSAAPYTQNVAISGMTAEKKIQVGLAPGATAAQYAAAANAQLHCTAQRAGAITITAFGTKPTIALPIIVRVVS